MFVGAWNYPYGLSLSLAAQVICLIRPCLTGLTVLYTSCRDFSFWGGTNHSTSTAAVCGKGSPCFGDQRKRASSRKHSPSERLFSGFPLAGKRSSQNLPVEQGWWRNKESCLCQSPRQLCCTRWQCLSHHASQSLLLPLWHLSLCDGE